MNTAISPVQPPRLLLKDRAYATLKSQILNNRYPPGTFLAERRLAADLGMSKTPVKAALERLALEGYVVISPQQCILVREMSAQEIGEHYEFRSAVESYVVRNLASRIEPQQIRAIQSQLELQQRALENRDVAQQVELDAEFHLLLAEQFGNQMIHKTMRELRDRTHRVITRAFRLSSERFKSSFREHQEIAAAVFEGRGDDAAALVVRHLERGRRVDPAFPD
jgi:DNA-binding GntR family transcriptional regulator